MHAVARTTIAAHLLATALTGPTAAVAAGVGTAPPYGDAYTPSYVGLTDPPDLLARDTRAERLGCDWRLNYGVGTTQNNAYPDSNAVYWLSIPPQGLPRGSVVRIQGTVPDARYFSITVYDSFYQVIDSIDDAHIVRGPGQDNPLFTSPTVRNPASPVGSSYEVDIIYDAASAAARYAAVNPVFVVSSSLGLVPSVVNLIYRVYVPYGTTASGDQPLPTVTVNGKAFTADPASPHCTSQVALALQNLNYGRNAPPGRTTSPPLRTPKFAVPSNSLYPGQNPSNAYLGATTPLPKDYLLIVRGRRPTYMVENPPVGDVVPVTRYWSLCQYAKPSSEVIACMADFQAATNADGLYYAVVSADDAPPGGATKVNGFNWMPFGPQSPGYLMLRLQHFQGTDTSPYVPKIVYCPKATFAVAAAGNPGNPAGVYDACASTPPLAFPPPPVGSLLPTVTSFTTSRG